MFLPSALPNSPRRNPQGLILLLINLCRDLSAHQHQVGSSVDDIRNKMLILTLQLESVFIDILSILLIDFLSVMPWIFDFLDLLDRLELDEKNYRINPVVPQPFHRSDMHIQDAV